MNVPCVALVLTLLSMASPVAGVICEIACAQPRAISSACHNDAADGYDRPVIADGVPSCGDAHVAERPALFTGARQQDQTVTYAPLPGLFAASARLEALVRDTSLPTHAPPRAASRSTISFTTLLRI